MSAVRTVRTPADWDRAVEIRIKVFVIEQKCPLEEEVDHYDAEALHLLAFDGEQAVGTARLVDRGDGVVKIGRVAVRAPWRGRQFGKALMDEALATARRRGYRTAVLDAQTYAIGFYERFGFVAEGPEFDDAGIPHRLMTLPLR